MKATSNLGLLIGFFLFGVGLNGQPLGLKEGVYLSYNELITNQVEFPIGELEIKSKEKKHGNKTIKSITWNSPGGEMELDLNSIYAIVDNDNIYIQYQVTKDKVVFGKQPKELNRSNFTPIHMRGTYGYLFIEERIPSSDFSLSIATKASSKNKFTCQKLFNINNGLIFEFSKPTVLQIIKDDKTLSRQLQENSISNWRVLLHTLEQYEKRKQVQVETSKIFSL